MMFRESGYRGVRCCLRKTLVRKRVIEIEKRICRIEAVLKGEYEKNLAIAKFPEKTYHRKQVQKNAAYYSVALYL